MRNWKTTLAGIGLSFIPFGQEILKMFAGHQPIDFRNIGLGAGFIVLGALAKDFNVVGAQPPVTVEPQETK